MHFLHSSLTETISRLATWKQISFHHFSFSCLMLSIDTNMAPKISLDLRVSYKIMSQAVSVDSKQNFPLKKKGQDDCRIPLKYRTYTVLAS